MGAGPRPSSRPARSVCWSLATWVAMSLANMNITSALANVKAARTLTIARDPNVTRRDRRLPSGAAVISDRSRHSTTTAQATPAATDAPSGSEYAYLKEISAARPPKIAGISAAMPRPRHLGGVYLRFRENPAISAA